MNGVSSSLDLSRQFLRLNSLFSLPRSFPAWISYLNLSILLGSLALALFNASHDSVARNFAVFYAVISVGILV